ncbi:MAG: hypothetical protein COA91_13665 [Robiginitomaculum sp.]|nr:MAG: hypothetical protein COA91_13665 [Robiginitomaculum sp.]
MDMNREKMQELLESGRKPDTDISLLQARILKAALQTSQDASSTGASYTNIASWKSIAATLILTTGIGFGLGQIPTQHSDYIAAETLLSISLANDYDETGLAQDFTGGQ